MTCQRCDGLMVSERICDLQGLSSDLCVDGYRCLLCGNVVDATILENRRQSAEALQLLAGSSTRVMELAVG
ncbi:MAG TPA: hypothetical protein DEA71_15580 [Nitrospira sp.]|nr:hypothetical protein [Nitrospira sp.]